MATASLALLAILYLGLSGMLIRQARRKRDLGAGVMAMVFLGLLYDSLVVAGGRLIGAGTLLEWLNRGRYLLHGALLPLFFVVAVDLAERGDARWAGMRSQLAAWIVALLLGITGLIAGFFLRLEPTAMAGTLRYTVIRATTPTWAHLLPVVISAASALFFIVVGVGLWRRRRWPWLTLAALVMVGLAGAAQGASGFLVTNLGEGLLALALFLTLQRVAHELD